ASPRNVIRSTSTSEKVAVRLDKEMMANAKKMKVASVPHPSHLLIYPNGIANSMKYVPRTAARNMPTALLDCSSPAIAHLLSLPNAHEGQLPTTCHAKYPHLDTSET